ncbi:roadblock/LC7 domain-containing protein [Cryptosporangium phraense]|uniref:Roadblock/LC7 domain-containing protein n=1 Tax=Cryptosporangium phraense TaxID=2593070 RepID=A0A545AL02_9ACTN|nr:roadblock/LC7 domain-containing protein [Cryptosporangium phraense]TQS41992.1 roadblock/LC7 domain-containing protein [Cryptosporangium phraense]
MTDMYATPATPNLSWVLDEFKRDTPDVQTVVAVSIDGISTYANTGLPAADNERLAAITSGFHSLAQGLGAQFEGGRVRQVVAELDQMLFFVAAAGRNTLLSVVAAPHADAGIVGYEMTLLARRVGDYFATASRVGSHRIDGFAG